MAGTSACRAYMMQQVQDAPRLGLNKQSFIGKPLKVLLHEIRPVIKMVVPNPSTNNQVVLGSITFRFVNPQQNDNYRLKGKHPVGVIVFVKELFDWDAKSRPPGEKLLWKKEDANRYGNLTIVDIRVYGEQ